MKRIKAYSTEIAELTESTELILGQAGDIFILVILQPVRLDLILNDLQNFLFSPKQTRSTRNNDGTTNLYGFKWCTDSSCALDTALTVYLYFYLASEDKIKNLSCRSKFNIFKLLRDINYESKILSKTKNKIITELKKSGGIHENLSIEEINSKIFDSMDKEHSSSLTYKVPTDCDMSGVVENEIMISEEVDGKIEQKPYSLFAVAYRLRRNNSDDRYIARIKVNDSVYDYDGGISHGLLKNVTEIETFPNSLGRQESSQIFYQAHIAWYKEKDFNTRYIYVMV